MTERMTPEDADLVAQRVVARLVRVIAAIAVTLLALSILPALFLYAMRASSPDGFPWPAIVMGLAALVVVIAIVRFWSTMLRGTAR